MFECTSIECTSIECNSIECDFHETPNMSANISNDQQFRLNKINKIKDYFIAEIKKEN